MALKKNEFAVNQCAAVRLDDYTVGILCYMYHTAEKEAKQSRLDKSQYRHELWIVRIDELERMIEDCKKPENRLKEWKWPNPTWQPEWFIGYDKFNDLSKAAKFYQSKLRKATDWETFVKRVNGVKTLGDGTERRGWKFAAERYMDSADGSTVDSILDAETLLSKVGHVLYRVETLKRDLPKGQTKAEKKAS